MLHDAWQYRQTKGILYPAASQPPSVLNLPWTISTGPQGMRTILKKQVCDFFYLNSFMNFIVFAKKKKFLQNYFVFNALAMNRWWFNTKPSVIKMITIKFQNENHL